MTTFLESPVAEVLLARVEYPGLQQPTLRRRRTDPVEPGDFATRLIACPPPPEATPLYPSLCCTHKARGGVEL